MVDWSSVIAKSNSDSSDRFTKSIVYATGDIHGRLDLLEALVEELWNSAGSALGDERITAIFLGDYIDRGPDSRGVLSRLIALRDERFCETVFLRGNHEQLLLEIIDGQSEAATWLKYGGLQTLRSYGIEMRMPADAAHIAQLPALLRSAVPASHLDFLRRTKFLHEMGDYVFAHAGLRPDRLLDEQSDFDLICRRHADEGSPVHGKIVVHGHTPSQQPVVGRWRIALDTAAYASGTLTALRLHDGRRQFLRVSSPPDAHKPTVSEWEFTDAPCEKLTLIASREFVETVPANARPAARKFLDRSRFSARFRRP